MRSAVLSIVVVALVAGSAQAALHDTGLRTTDRAVVDAPCSAAWDAFTTERGILSWMGVKRASIDLRIGGLLRTSYADAPLDGPQGIAHRLLAFEPERFLAFSGEKAPEGSGLDEFLDSWWTVRFEPVDERHCEVSVGGFGWESDPEWDRVRESFRVGNAWTMQQLVKRFADEGADERAERVLSLLRRLVGSEWVARGRTPDGRPLIVRNVVELAPDGRSIVARGWLGDPSGLGHHSALQAWREPETGAIRFQDLGEDGAIHRGAITLRGPDELQWDFRPVAAGADAARLLVVQSFAGPDRYRQRFLTADADGRWQPVGSPLDFRRQREGEGDLPPIRTER